MFSYDSCCANSDVLRSAHIDRSTEFPSFPLIIIYMYKLIMRSESQHFTKNTFVSCSLIFEMVITFSSGLMRKLCCIFVFILNSCQNRSLPDNETLFSKKSKDNSLIKQKQILMKRFYPYDYRRNFGEDAWLPRIFRCICF